MRPIIWICIALYAVAMAAVGFAARGIVGHFGFIGGVLTVAAMYATARYFERLRA